MLVVQVVNMITSCRKRNTTEDRTTFSQSILDTPVCQDAFGRLLFIGKERMQKLWKAVRSGVPPPRDGRFLKQTRQYRKMQGSTEKQQAVVEFLTEMHATVAEYMPEANRARDTASPVPKTTESQNGNDTVPIGLRFRKRTGKRPRKSVSMNFGKDTTALKMLPPGTFTGYLALLNARREGKDKISLKMFNEVWAESFGTRLAIRPVSRHALCSVCLRHKLIIRKCGADEVARDIQCRQYEQHLKLQYKDRTCYWEKRGLARLRSLQGNGLYPLSLIMDGADHSKFACPRSGVFSGKDFSSLHRPTMDLVGCLLHGQSACLALSHPRLAKDSSYWTELLYHMLHRVSSRVDLRQAELFLQADNTTREVKNNTLLRAISLLVACHRLARGQLSCLMSGHSHEDIDQLFASMNTFIERHSDIPTPSAFKEVLGEFFWPQQAGE
ncbi:unnamed protein product [Symbiodinium sp. CCMP2592]|nr:unnamed protein product [Symbiodinium sp. CCMP2592]